MIWRSAISIRCNAPWKRNETAPGGAFEMSQSRLSIALAGQGLKLPDAGRIAVFAPAQPVDLSALPRERVQVIQPFRPEHDRLTSQGYDCVLAPDGSYRAAVVFVPRAKQWAQALVAQAMAVVADGPVILDGQKTDGIESLLKAVRKRVQPGGVLSKAHGKLFWMASGDQFADWAEVPANVAPGLMTVPGVFSADGIDPGSAMLAGALPDTLGPVVVDLGAGWGYLGREILKRDTVTTCHLVEADHRALDCARINVTDARARFHWADATRWSLDEPADTVVCNPPFHTGRAAEPDLGRAFIQSAARLLKPSGRLWLVANRHLPYEPALDAHFARCQEIAGNSRFKVLLAERPTRQKRK